MNRNTECFQHNYGNGVVALESEESRIIREKVTAAILSIVEGNEVLAVLREFRIVALGQDLRPNGDGRRMVIANGRGIGRLYGLDHTIEEIVNIIANHLISTEDLDIRSMADSSCEYIYNQWNVEIGRTCVKAVSSLIGWLTTTNEWEFKNECTTQVAIVGLTPQPTTVELAGPAIIVEQTEDYMVGDWKVRPVRKAKPGFISRGDRARDINKNIRALVDKLGLSSTLAESVNLPLLQRIAIFKAMGIIEPGLPWLKFRKLIHRRTEHLYDALDQGVRALKKQEDGIGSIQAGSEVVDDQWVKLQVQRMVNETNQACTSAGKWLGRESGRGSLMAILPSITEEQWVKVSASLTDNERTVICFIRSCSGMFQPSIAETVTATGISHEMLFRIYRKLARLLQGEIIRYQGTDGKLMVDHQYPASILALLREFRESDWEKLRLLQQEILTFISTPNQKGQYPIYEEIEARFGKMSTDDLRSTNLRLYIHKMAYKMRGLIKAGKKEKK